MSRLARVSIKNKYAATVAALLGMAAAYLLTSYAMQPLVRAAGKRSAIKVNRIYTGQDGLSHAEKVEMQLEGSSAIPGMEQSALFENASMRFARRPPALVQDWHPSNQPQYAVTISGRGEIEVAGGQKVVLEPGSVLLVEDVGGNGHKTRTLGSQDWTLMIVNLPKK